MWKWFLNLFKSNGYGPWSDPFKCFQHKYLVQVRFHKLTNEMQTRETEVEPFNLDVFEAKSLICKVN